MWVKYIVIVKNDGSDESLSITGVPSDTAVS